MEMFKLLYLVSQMQIGIATTFWNQDVYNPNPKLYCTNKNIDDKQLIAAHPKLPCGTKVLVYNIRNGKSVLVTILDRGPRHAKIDLSIGASKVIESNGKEDIIMVPLKNF